MKNILIILFLLVKTSVQAQFDYPPEVQFSLQPRLGVTNDKTIIGGIDNAFAYHHFEWAASLIMDRYEACYFGLRVGYFFKIGTNMQIMPLITPSYKYTSSDKNEYTVGKNYWVWNYGLRFNKKIFFLQAEYLEDFQFTLGAVLK